jgi:deazaflavin-dependent oxidoreductase (nitroreductase family)
MVPKATLRRNKESVPHMPLSRRVARFNKLINNRIQGIYAWLLPPWAVILHRGRRSGSGYRTPVLAFRRGDTVVIALLYGEESDWLRNLAAGPGSIVRAGRTFAVGPPRVVATEDASVLLQLSAFARRYCRLAAKQVTLELLEQQPGFGPRRGQHA